MSGKIDAATRRSRVELVVALVSLIIAVFFAISTIVTRSYFAAFNEDLLKTLSFPDYSTFGVDFIYPVLLMIVSVLVISIIWLMFTRLVISLTGTLFVKGNDFIRLVYNWGRKFSHFFVPMAHIGYLRHFGNGRFQALQSDSSQENSSRGVVVRQRFWFSPWDWILSLVPLFFLSNVIALTDGFTLLNLGTVSILLLIYIFGFWSLWAILDASFKRRLEINGRLVRNQSDFDTLSPSENEAFWLKANEVAGSQDDWKSLISVTYSIGALLLISEEYGQSAALDTHAQMLGVVTNGERPVGDVTIYSTSSVEEKSRRAFEGSDVIRVIEQGIIAFDNNPSRVIFVNDHGQIRASFQLKYFIAPSEFRALEALANRELDSSERDSLKLRAQRKLERLRTESSLCLRDRMPAVDLLAAPGRAFLRLLPLLKSDPKPAKCDKLIDLFQDALNKQSNSVNAELPKGVGDDVSEVEAMSTDTGADIDKSHPED